MQKLIWLLTLSLSLSLYGNAVFSVNGFHLFLFWCVKINEKLKRKQNKLLKNGHKVSVGDEFSDVELEKKYVGEIPLPFPPARLAFRWLGIRTRGEVRVCRHNSPVPGIVS